MRPGWAARAALPEFPWDRLAPYGDKARQHPGGIVDLSIGTPVDPTPAVVQAALRAAADSPGYPLTIGTVATRQACVDWLSRRFGVTGLDVGSVLPVIGSKELIASLPTHLGLGGRDRVEAEHRAREPIDLCDPR
jgi:aspartate/methionine/tyrosine aminotransferase